MEADAIRRGLHPEGVVSYSMEQAETTGDGVWDAGGVLDRHRESHRLGIATAAGMIFGQNETLEQRVDYLFALRGLQEETGGFFSFTPSVFQHDVAAGGRSLEEATSVEYLKTLAICRMVLDNIPNMQANWRTQGTKTMQMALRFGANDVGSAGDGASEEDLRRIIRDAGFRPVQRDGVYRVMFLD